MLPEYGWCVLFFTRPLHISFLSIQGYSSSNRSQILCCCINKIHRCGFKESHSTILLNTVLMVVDLISQLSTMAQQKVVCCCVSQDHKWCQAVPEKVSWWQGRVLGMLEHVTGLVLGDLGLFSGWIMLAAVHSGLLSFFPATDPCPEAPWTYTS